MLKFDAEIAKEEEAKSKEEEKVTRGPPAAEPGKSPRKLPLHRPSPVIKPKLAFTGGSSPVKDKSPTKKPSLGKKEEGSKSPLKLGKKS